MRYARTRYRQPVPGRKDSARSAHSTRSLGQLRFSMRSRMLGALVLTALATLVAAALALLAPLESQLRGDSIRIGEGTVTVDRGRLSNLPLTPAGEPVLRALDARLEQFFRINSATYVVWDERLTRIDDTDRDDRRAIDRIAPNVVRRALYGSSKTPHTLRSDVLVVTIRYRDRAMKKKEDLVRRRRDRGRERRAQRADLGCADRVWCRQRVRCRAALAPRPASATAP